MIAEMPDGVIPMDFHLHKIEINDNFLTMEIDYTWNILLFVILIDELSIK